MDGLRDYADDYSDRAVATGVIRTLYKVGRGFMRDVEADKDDAAAEAISAHDPDLPVRAGENAEPADATASPPTDEESDDDPADTGGDGDPKSKA
jgi:hypothetical protein